MSCKEFKYVVLTRTVIRTEQLHFLTMQRIVTLIVLLNTLATVVLCIVVANEFRVE
jgi:hypothetical protein